MFPLKFKVDIGDTSGYGDLVRSSVSIFTPDIARLEKYQYQKVFICDDLMSDRRGHVAIKDDIKTKVIGFTKDRFNFLIHSPGGEALPVAQSDGYRIKGEICVIRSNVFWNKLDKLMLNRVKYLRRRVIICDPFREERLIDNGTFTEDGFLLPEAIKGKKRWLGPETIFHQEAWMYFPKRDYWEYIISRRPEIFNRVPTFEPKVEKKWLDSYFKYQNPIED